MNTNVEQAPAGDSRDYRIRDMLLTAGGIGEPDFHFGINQCPERNLSVGAKSPSRFGLALFQSQASRRPCIDASGERTDAEYAAFMQLHRHLCRCRFIEAAQ